MANSYKYIEKPDFRVVRDASVSIQPKKGRPLLSSVAKTTDKEAKSDALSLNESGVNKAQSLDLRIPQSLEA